MHSYIVSGGIIIACMHASLRLYPLYRLADEHDLEWTDTIHILVYGVAEEKRPWGTTPSLPRSRCLVREIPRNSAACSKGTLCAATCNNGRTKKQRVPSHNSAAPRRNPGTVCSHTL